MNELYIIIFIIVILIIYLLYKVHENDIPIGGCKGTIYGCCPNSVNAKRNSLGTNC